MTKIAFSHMALVEKIPPGDPVWSAFNGSFSNMDLETIEIVNLIYQGHPFTTWHKNSWRHSKNYELGQHIGIDFDTEDEHSTLRHLAADKFVQRYGSVVYTTPSHTPAAPRARILFLLDAPIHQPQNYTLAVSTLLWLFGSADRQCKDPVRFFYGSMACDVEYIEQVLPLTVLKGMIKQYQATGSTIKRRQERSIYHAPADQEKVEAALKHIPALGIDYDEWVRVLMGIHAEFGDGGLPLAESWGKGQGDEIARKFRSFASGGNVSGAVSIASVFKLAQDNGWQSEG